MVYFGVSSIALRIDFRELRVNGAVSEGIEEAAVGNESIGEGMYT